MLVRGCPWCPWRSFPAWMVPRFCGCCRREGELWAAGWHRQAPSTHPPGVTSPSCLHRARAAPWEPDKLLECSKGYWRERLLRNLPNIKTGQGKVISCLCFVLILHCCSFPAQYKVTSLLMPHTFISTSIGLGRYQPLGLLRRWFPSSQWLQKTLPSCPHGTGNAVSPPLSLITAQWWMGRHTPKPPQAGAGDPSGVISSHLTGMKGWIRI